MTSERSPDAKFEIGHVLFIDIVGYSKLLINEQSEQIRTLKEIVRGTEQFRLAQAEGKLLRLPTGDGGALVFRNSLEAPVLCSMEIARALKDYPKLRVRTRWTAIAATLALLAAIIAAFMIVSKKSPKLTSTISEKSIAVLPFENRSEDKANAYFADGVQDEILTRLSKIADLKVISRTSTQHYKSAPENLPEIAKQLGVAHILEGSVQKSGDAVRVNVQLIKAANDSHLWADTFDRKLTDIFSVETEVAKAIAEQLRAHLSGREEQ